jgi:hypothetical protein
LFSSEYFKTICIRIFSHNNFYSIFIFLLNLSILLVIEVLSLVHLRNRNPVFS